MSKIAKKSLCFTLVFVLVFALVPAISFAAVPNPMEGSGTATDPFIITHEFHLRTMRTDARFYYRLGRDITLTDGIFTPIGTSRAPFRGAFDGGGFGIYNLNVSVVSGQAGLFGITNGALLHNIRIRSGSIHSTTNYAGGIVGSALNTIITDSYSLIPVTGRRRVGGIAGHGSNTVIDRSFTTGTIRSTFASSSTTYSANAGGIVGVIENNSLVRNSFSWSDVYALHHRVGGIAGGSLASDIVNTYSTGNITGRGRLGGIVGHRNNASQIENNFAMNRFITITGTNTTIGRVARDGTFNFNLAYRNMVLSNRDGATLINPPPAHIGQGTRGGLCMDRGAFSSQANFVARGWNFRDVWVMDPNISPYPTLGYFTPDVINFEIEPNPLVLSDIGSSDTLTAISTDPDRPLPTNLEWIASPVGYIDFAPSADTRSALVTATNTRPGEVVYVTVTLRSGGVTLPTTATVMVGDADSASFGIYLPVGDTVRMGKWRDDAPQAATWESSNEFFATVDADGIVSAIAEGNTTISTDGFRLNVRVTSNVQPTSIYIEEPDSDILGVGEEVDLIARLLPIESMAMPVTWTSSNPGVIFLDTNNTSNAITILGMTPGYSDIMATVMTDGGPLFYTMRIYVRVLPTEIVIRTECEEYSNAISLHEMTLSESEVFTAVFTPDNTTDSDVVWHLLDEVDNPSIIATFGNQTDDAIVVIPNAVGIVYLVAEPVGFGHNIEPAVLRIEIVSEPGRIEGITIHGVPGVIDQVNRTIAFHGLSPGMVVNGNFQGVLSGLEPSEALTFDLRSNGGDQWSGFGNGSNPGFRNGDRVFIPGVSPYEPIGIVYTLRLTDYISPTFRVGDFETEFDHDAGIITFTVPLGFPTDGVAGAISGLNPVVERLSFITADPPTPVGETFGNGQMVGFRDGDTVISAMGKSYIIRIISSP